MNIVKGGGGEGEVRGMGNGSWRVVGERREEEGDRGGMLMG